MSTLIPSRIARTAWMSVPSSILPPLGSSETETWIGTRAADPLERGAGADDRGPDLEDVLGRLDDQQVGAALDEGPGLLVEDLRELREGDLAESRVVAGGQEAGRADRAGDEALRPGRLAGDLGGPAVDLHGPLAEPPLVELQPRALEGIGLDDLRSGLQHRRVDPGDDVGSMEDERLVTLAGQTPVSSLERSKRSRVAPMPPSKTTIRSRAAARMSRSGWLIREVTSIGPGCRTVPRRCSGGAGCGGFRGPGPSAALDGRTPRIATGRVR